jgi:uncharacterized membrane protein
MLESVLELLQGIPEELIVFLISLLPILELRGGLIAASLLGIEYWVALPICIIGNLLPIPFILLFIRKVLSWLKKTKPFKKLVEKIEEKAEKNKGKITKYAKWGLYLFVAVPLPGTGAWTGALVADALDIHVKKSFPVIALGVLTAGIIMVIFAYFFPELFMKLFG